MIRLAWQSQVMITAVMLAVGGGSLTAGLFDFKKPDSRTPRKGVIARGQEPNPAPPATLDAAQDPAYANPAPPAVQPTPLPDVAMPWQDPSLTSACPPPAYSGFSGNAPAEPGMPCGACGSCPVGVGPREPRGCCEKLQRCLARSCRRMCGQSYYCDCYPLFGPRYGYYDTCWRRLPEDCRCPIYVPPRKSASASEPTPEDPSAPQEETVPPPPQVLNFR